MNTLKLRPSTVIEKTWEAMPGAILCFPVSIALSGGMADRRAKEIAATTEERNENLIDFRMRMLADICNSEPYCIRIAALEAALTAKIEAALDELGPMPGMEDTEGQNKWGADTARIRKSTKLSREEVDALHEPFPGLAEVEGETLEERLYKYFNQDDEQGRKTFQLLVEEIVQEYWIWAVPRPTSSVSAFMQDR